MGVGEEQKGILSKVKNIFKGRKHWILEYVRNMKLYSLAEAGGVVIYGMKLKEGFLRHMKVFG
jgi:hypothetical protein